MSQALKSATENALVVIDEFGKGTSSKKYGSDGQFLFLIG
jgi:DNA mismatch repair ATPase MutS